MTLAELRVGQFAVVESVETGLHGQGLKNRLEAMGIFPGKTIRVLRKAAMGGPLGVRVGSTTEIAIRSKEAALVVLKPNHT